MDVTVNIVDFNKNSIRIKNIGIVDTTTGEKVKSLTLNTVEKNKNK